MRAGCWNPSLATVARRPLQQLVRPISYCFGGIWNTVPAVWKPKLVGLPVLQRGAIEWHRGERWADQPERGLASVVPSPG
jgi:hypothetical protein